MDTDQPPGLAPSLRTDPWPLPVVPSPSSLARGTRSRLLHDDGTVQIVAWACMGACDELRCERTHSHHVVTLLRRGACTVRQSGRTLAVDPATALVHRPGTTYRTEHPWGYVDAGWSLAYDAGTAQEILEACPTPPQIGRPSRLVHVPRLRDLTHPVATLLRLERGAAVDPMTAREAALDLFARLHDPDAFSWSPSDPDRRSELRVVERACESLRANLDRPVRLAQIAGDVGCSEFRLYRAFRRQRGTSPGAYLRRLRLAAVLDGLADADRSLMALALDTGFSHHSHLTATFRRQLGRTPKEVRAQIRSKRGQVQVPE